MQKWTIGNDYIVYKIVYTMMVKAYYMTQMYRRLRHKTVKARPSTDSPQGPN